MFAAAKMGTVNFDAWRVQMLDDNRRVAIFSKNAFDLAPQLHAFAARLSQLAGCTPIINGELVASDERNQAEILFHFKQRGCSGSDGRLQHWILSKFRRRAEQDYQSKSGYIVGYRGAELLR